MIPFYVMLAAIAVARGAGALAWAPLDDWQAATRVGLAVMFLFTGAAHFDRTRRISSGWCRRRSPIQG